MRRVVLGFALVMAGGLVLIGCHSATKQRHRVDKVAAKIIEEKQMEALGRVEPFTIEQPADTLRRRLLIAQNLAYTGPASLGTQGLEPIEHWPDDEYLASPESVSDATALEVNDQPLHLTLVETLQVAARNSREYQSQKERVFSTALRLDRERDIFRNTFSGSFDGTLTQSESGGTTRGRDGSFLGGVGRQLLNGISLSTRIGLDIAQLLKPDRVSSKSVYTDSSITIPLLRGAGKHIVAEPLTQAEREVVYAVYDFEEYKRTFAVRVANSYLSVLRAGDQINNAEENYRSSVRSARYVRRQADAGKRGYTVVEVGQAVQRELSAQNSWVRAKQDYERSLDQFKIQLGLPTDSKIELDRTELDRVVASMAYITAKSETSVLDEEVPAADAPVVLEEPSREDAGPMELDEAAAIQLAFGNRLDLRITQGNVYDAQRAVVVAADRLKPELTLLGTAGTGEGRSMGSADRPDATSLDLDKGVYSALLSVDLPLERTSEAIAYRESLISLESAARNLQDMEDQIKLNVRDGLRTLLQSRIGVKIEAMALELAQSRVEDSDLRLQAGRAIVRDLLEAQDALISAQNALTRAIVDYRNAELALQRDLGVLQVNEEGLWREYSPQEVGNEK